MQSLVKKQPKNNHAMGLNRFPVAQSVLGRAVIDVEIYL